MVVLIYVHIGASEFMNFKKSAPDIERCNQADQLSV